MIKKQFIVIGLGRFGTSVAETLYSLGNDVLAVDVDEEVIQNISEKVTHAVQVDANDEQSLRALGVGNFDVAIISIGSDIQASILSTLLVKELGVKHIITKANNALHAKVLYKIGANRVIFPERDMGVRVAHNLCSSNILDYIELSPDFSIAEIVSPQEWHEKSLKDLNLRAEYGINVMAIKRNNEIDVSPSADEIIEANDIIVAIGGNQELNNIEKLVR
ncbi:trkA-N domain protein [Clostridium argentinense CDC 2741]|uniref:TrkA-N domain protein n=1 Tax=Clostridium argentinense CDC 2741 TaxID=1418104 RepID=A0A0C1UJE2_9CLOT|nr:MULTISPECIES: TrkA family potassium uptake protein [Clostridium]ARC84472.1 potassium transporter Trk [Clostridium argentinense]KIE47390.1 trkA-N domain protein [Clostridium argentinense CDC 2741]NFF38745.1 TrkA family potassium uptake protein [Clostridium argentinense]NFP72573.1 TrkA family potassium uptake protein [Clostridium argentinense]NFP75750.1 TrkA family potassium uptake protein [Clostridium argentinense]